MDKDAYGVIGFLLMVVVMVAGTGYYGYRQGRKAERVSLTMELIAQTKDTYYEGYSDGEKSCLRVAK